MVVSGKDIIKYATETFVRYLDTRPNKPKQKQEKPKEQMAYYDRWFGVLPFLVKTAFKSRKK